MKVAVIKSGSYLDKKIMMILKEKNINGDIIQKCNQYALMRYDVIIFTYKNAIPNLPKLLEQLVLEKKSLIIHIKKNKHVGLFYNLQQDLFYLPILEINMALQLGSLINQTHKYLRKIMDLSKEKQDFKEKFNHLRNENKAKRILMKSGLTEEKAHRFIIDEAMQRRKAKNYIVNLIIKKKIDIK
ncbi:MAG: hypothetical protein K9L74_01535 [Candidatus Izimaplasma sp.]|nr:hypothetical protein [Candidatus Izimaplasma bacterium]